VIKMNTLSPKLMFTTVVQSWPVAPGMVFAVAEDLERRIWIVESTPVGRHYWTVEQARELPHGHRTGPVLKQAIALGQRLERENLGKPYGPVGMRIPPMMPEFPEGEIDSNLAHGSERIEEHLDERLDEKTHAYS